MTSKPFVIARQKQPVPPQRQGRFSQSEQGTQAVSTGKASYAHQTKAHEWL